MKKKYKAIIIGLIVVAVLVVAGLYLRTTNIQVLNPKGPIALKERDLIYTALLLSLVVVIPVYGLTIGFVWRYRESNKKAKYSPNLTGNRIAETIWWIIPTVIITILAVITWRSSHQLDPYQPISSTTQPINIEVVALDWKWLFIYPKQNIASVNFFQFPKDTPLDFDITSDAPMNSFWIPQLGGQIYAMPGMSTELHLMATSYGSFNGSSANISGNGFAGMTFIAKSTTTQSFSQWVKETKHSGKILSSDEYASLSVPSEYNRPAFYAAVQNNLYSDIINKYMVPAGSSDNPSNMDGMYMQ